MFMAVLTLSSIVSTLRGEGAQKFTFHECLLPSSELVYPCTCREMLRDSVQVSKSITCSYNSGDQIKEVFNNLGQLEESEKHLLSVELTGDGLDELPEQVFNDITFSFIEIRKAKNLTKIHTNAFKFTQIGRKS